MKKGFLIFNETFFLKLTPFTRYLCPAGQAECGDQSVRCCTVPDSVAFISRFQVPDAGHSLDSRRSKRMILIAGIPCPVSIGIKPPSRVDNRDSG